MSSSQMTTLPYQFVCLLCLVSIFFVRGVSAQHDTVNTTTEQPSHLNSPEIVGGDDARPGEFPWQAMLVDSNERFACAAVLIHLKWLMTAAHCINRSDITKVILGAHDRTDNTEPTRQTLAVARLIPHPTYNPQTLDNDIGLIELQRAVTVNAWVQPLPLMANDQVQLRASDTPAVVTGWGTTAEHGLLATVLQKVVVPITSQDSCRAAYPGAITENMFCAGEEKGGKDSCQGDSGGPLIVSNPDHQQGWVVAGIVSWGNGCARPGSYGVYTDVSRYTSWVVEITRGAILDPLPVVHRPIVDATSTPMNATPVALIQNGSFEERTTEPWQIVSLQSQALIGTVQPIPALDGDHAAQLGGVNLETSRLLQPVNIPASNRLYLLFGYQIRSEEKRCDRDIAKVFVGTRRLTQFVLCHENNTTAWQRLAIDVTALAESTHQLQFLTATDQQNPSTFYIDNILLMQSIENQHLDRLIEAELIVDSDAGDFSAQSEPTLEPTNTPAPSDNDNTIDKPTATAEAPIPPAATTTPSATTTPTGMNDGPLHPLYLPFIQR